MKHESFVLSKPSFTDDMAIWQKYFIEKAEFEHDISRQDFASALDVGTPYISMLKTSKHKSYLTMSQIREFAALGQMTDVDVIDLFAVLFQQKDGRQIDFDLSTMRWLFSEVFRLLQEHKIDQSHPLFTILITESIEVVASDTLGSDLSSSSCLHAS